MLEEDSEFDEEHIDESGDFTTTAKYLVLLWWLLSMVLISKSVVVGAAPGGGGGGGGGALWGTTTTTTIHRGWMSLTCGMGMVVLRHVLYQGNWAPHNEVYRQIPLEPFLVYFSMNVIAQTVLRFFPTIPARIFGNLIPAEDISSSPTRGSSFCRLHRSGWASFVVSAFVSHETSVAWWRAQQHDDLAEESRIFSSMAALIGSSLGAALTPTGHVHSVLLMTLAYDVITWREFTRDMAVALLVPAVVGLLVVVPRVWQMLVVGTSSARSATTTMRSHYMRAQDQEEPVEEGDEGRVIEDEENDEHRVGLELCATRGRNLVAAEVPDNSAFHHSQYSINDDDNDEDHPEEEAIGTFRNESESNHIGNRRDSGGGCDGAPSSSSLLFSPPHWLRGDKAVVAVLVAMWLAWVANANIVMVSLLAACTVHALSSPLSQEETRRSKQPQPQNGNPLGVATTYNCGAYLGHECSFGCVVHECEPVPTGRTSARHRAGTALLP